METNPIKERIDVPPPRQMMAIDRAAWTRLKRLVNRLNNPKGYWQNAAWFASAGAISFLLALTASATSSGLTSWVSILFITLTAVFMVAAGILFMADFSIGSRNEATRQDVIEEMQEIEVQSTGNVDVSAAETQLIDQGEEVTPS